jgi:hypothetical protein
MKSIITFWLLSGFAFTAKYPAGKVCRSNVECNTNCLDS